MIEIKNIQEFKEVAEGLTYRFAKTYAHTHPHEYHWAETNENKQKVQALNKYIQEHGEMEMFYTTPFEVIFVGDYKYWSIEHWSKTNILNRNWDFKNKDGGINKSITESKKNEKTKTNN